MLSLRAPDSGRREGGSSPRRGSGQWQRKDSKGDYDAVRRSMRKAGSSPLSGRSNRQSHSQLPGTADPRASATALLTKDSKGTQEAPPKFVKKKSTKKFKDKVRVKKLAEPDDMDSYLLGGRRSAHKESGDASFESSCSFESSSSDGAASVGAVSARSKRSKRSAKHSARPKHKAEEKNEDGQVVVVSAMARKFAQAIRLKLLSEIKKVDARQAAQQAESFRRLPITG